MDFLPETFPISSAPGTGPGGATTIDDIEGLAAALAEKYSDDNNPAIADIIGLVTALAGKQATPLGASDISTDLGTSTGTANALAGASLVDTSNTFEAGRLYWVKANLANTGAATLAKNGGTAVAIRKNPNSAALAGGDIAANALILLRYDGTYLQFVAGRGLLPGDMPFGFAPYYGTTGGNGGAFTATAPAGVKPMTALVDGATITCKIHTNNTSGATLAVDGLLAKNIARPTTSGNVGTTQLAGNKIYSFTYAATADRWVISSPYILDSSDIPTNLNQTSFGSGLSVNANTIGRGVAGADLAIYGGTADSNGGTMRAVGSSSANQPGTIILQCKMILRAASTNYNLISIPATFHGQITLIDDVMTGNVITEVQIKAGAIVGITGDTTCYITGSPTGDQMQLSISGAFLVGLTGNTYTRTLGASGPQAGLK